MVTLDAKQHFETRKNDFQKLEPSSAFVKEVAHVLLEKSSSEIQKSCFWFPQLTLWAGKRSLFLFLLPARADTAGVVNASSWTACEGR